MQCFSHQDVAAIGVCRTCGKGLCLACAREIDRGIVCSEPCAEFALVNHQIVDRAKRIYSIGTRPKIPLGTWFFGVVGVIALVMAVVEWEANNDAWLSVAGIGILFLGFSLFTWQRYRSVGLSL